MSLKLETKFDYSNVDYKKENEVHLQVKLIGDTLPSTEKRVPLNLVVAIDVSGSMMGQKIDTARKTLIKLIDNLTDQDKLGIVAFTDSVWTVQKPTFMTSDNKNVFRTEVNGLSAKSMTNFSGALILSEKDMFENLDTKFDVNRVIVLTDGQPTTGECNFDGLTGILAGIMKNTKVSYSFFGFGQDVNAELLTSLAKLGKGNYYYIDNIEKIKTVFAKELGGLISVVAQNVKVKLTSSSDVKILEVLNDLDVVTTGDTTEISFDDVFAEEERFVIIKLQLPAKTKAVAARPTTVSELSVSWFNIIEKKDSSQDLKVKINFVTNGKVDTIPDADVEKNVALLVAAKLQDEARKKADAGDYAGSRAILSSSIDYMKGTQAYASGDATAMGWVVQSADFLNVTNSSQYTANVSNTMASATMDSLVGSGRSTSTNLYANSSSVARMVKNFTEDEPVVKQTTGATGVTANGLSGGATLNNLTGYLKTRMNR